MSRSLGVSLAAALIGTLSMTLGAFVDPTRVAFSYLAACAYAVTIALGALFWVMIAHVTGAFWIVPLRRIAENISLALVPLALLLVPLSLAAELLYPWAGAFGSREVPQHLRGYFREPAFLLRSLVCFLVFAALALGLRRFSRAQEREPHDRYPRLLEALSAAGLPLFAISLSLFAFDWLMPLDPEWRSTMYGVYVFAGSALSGLALIVFTAHLARAAGRLPGEIGAAHTLAAGKLLLTFLLFWAYTGFSQFLIVWMADIPFESIWYVRRGTGGWAWVSATLVVLHFAVPFAILLSNGLKRKPPQVALLSAWFLLVHYIDVYWLVLPGLDRSGPAPHWLDAAALLQVGGVCAACVMLWSKNDELLPLNDPRLPEALALLPVEP